VFTPCVSVAKQYKLVYGKNREGNDRLWKRCGIPSITLNHWILTHCRLKTIETQMSAAPVGLYVAWAVTGQYWLMSFFTLPYLMHTPTKLMNSYHKPKPGRSHLVNWSKPHKKQPKVWAWIDMLQASWVSQSTCCLFSRFINYLINQNKFSLYGAITKDLVASDSGANSASQVVFWRLHSASRRVVLF